MLFLLIEVKDSIANKGCLNDKAEVTSTCYFTLFTLVKVQGFTK